VIVDSHHHLWRVRDLAWLRGPMQPRIFGPYAPIRRDYLAEEYVADATANGIGQSVYVQANWPLEQSVEEVRWVHSVHEQSGWPHAIVASADLFDGAAVETFAAAHAASPLVRGVRLQLHWHENPQYRYASGPRQMHDPTFRANVAALADYGWLFELQVFAAQMQDAAQFVADYPQTTFVLVHSGMLEGDVGEWRAGLERLAAQPNVVTKLSGQGTFVHRVDADLIRLVTDTALELFGPDRCMFGTNFPVERIWTDMRTLVDAWKAAIPEDAAAAVFRDTARRVYRLAS